MKAIRIHETGGPDALRLDEVEKPRPSAGQVLIKVAAAGVNYADIMQREGTYLEPTKPPATLGLEVAGTVEELGEGYPGLWWERGWLPWSKAGMPNMSWLIPT